MTKQTQWLLIGLAALLVLGGGGAAVISSTYSAVIQKIVNAIAAAEGYYVAGSRPNRNNNPGDFETDITGKGVGFDGPYVIYATAQDGFDALAKQVSLMFGGSSIYNPSMSITEIGFHYADGAHDPAGAAAWAANVANALGVDVSTTLSSLASLIGG